jgi:uncharacterized protein YfeS
MKLLYFLFLLLSSSARSQDHKRMQIPFETLLNIGDCLVYQIDPNSYTGLFLYQITKEEDNIHYGFLLSGKTFSSKPDLVSFREAGFWGSRIPTYGTPKTTMSPYIHSIEERKLKTFIKNLKKIGSIYLDTSENRISSNGGFSSVEEIITYGTAVYKNKKKEHTILDPPQPELINYNEMSLSDRPGKTPEEVWVLSKKSAHPNAKALMLDDWLWDQSDEFTPFGNDAGSDALYLFKEWRSNNRKSEPAAFISVLEKKWGAPFTHQVNETNYNKIKDEAKTNIFYSEIDKALIAIAFAQLVLEGHISKQSAEYAQKAIERQKMLTENNDYQYVLKVKAQRLERLTGMLEIIKKAVQK